MALYWPVDAGISQQFASSPNSIQPNGHTGIDFRTPLNTPIRAAGAGTVVFANWATTLSANNPWWIAPAYAGITVVIDHGNGLLTLYAHLNKTDLNAGDRVSQGQVIGLSGSTGLSTGPHLHFEVLGWPLQPYNGFYGRLNPNKHISTFVAPAASSPNQRLVGPDNVNQRSKPLTSSDVVRIIPANTVETFTGFIHGGEIGGNDIWYADAVGFAWSGGFTTQSTNGLKDITPAPIPVLTPNQRVVGADNTNQRTEPNTSASVIRIIPANTTETFTGFVYGEPVAGINVWFKDKDGYAWAGGFTSQDTTGLPDLTPAPVPVVPEPPAPTAYGFRKDFDFVEYEPAHSSNVQIASDNLGVVVFPAQPTHAVLHQFDAKAKQPSIAGVINHFQTERPGSESSAHFAVSGDRIVQLVSLKDRAYHAGKVGNNYIGIEVDPDEDALTVASVRKLLTALELKYGYKFTYIKHRDVPGNSTLCGEDIHLDLYNLDVPVTPPVTEPPVIVPEPTPPMVITPAIEREIIEKFFKQVLDKHFS